MKDVVDYTSGPYQQFVEEPRMQEIDIMNEPEVLVVDSIPYTRALLKKKRTRKNKKTRGGNKNKKGAKCTKGKKNKKSAKM